IAAGNNQILITVTFTVAANAPVGATPLTLSNVNASSDAPQLFTPTATGGKVTILAQTAANVNVSGRVLQTNGRGVANARVEMTDQGGNVRTARTNPFGYYRFNEVAVGETYIISAKHKNYEFDSQALAVNGSLSEVNLSARETVLNFKVFQ
ncbi:MAG: carboxypeptidase regulatory-like domain-containing protein, partial [Pyrinomonadaceae bacterium]|nr:carboxypeptidase regulatory-like domain-containing protein [Pyrinomonadaceae bacterium]